MAGAEGEELFPDVDSMQITVCEPPDGRYLGESRYWGVILNPESRNLDSDGGYLCEDYVLCPNPE